MLRFGLSILPNLFPFGQGGVPECQTNMNKKTKTKPRRPFFQGCLLPVLPLRADLSPFHRRVLLQPPHGRRPQRAGSASAGGKRRSKAAPKKEPETPEINCLGFSYVV